MYKQEVETLLGEIKLYKAAKSELAEQVEVLGEEKLILEQKQALAAQQLQSQQVSEHLYVKAIEKKDSLLHAQEGQLEQLVKEH